MPTETKATHPVSANAVDRRFAVVIDTPKERTPQTAKPNRASAPQPAGLRLDHLDGLRGLASLYVVIYHVYLVLSLHGAWGKLPLLLQKTLAWTQYGHISVTIFIVLSGYCLALPLARSGTRRLSGGLRDFAFRRARRLLPPYYAALTMSFLLVGGAYLFQSSGTQHLEMAANFTPNSLLSHLFLVHNLHDSTAYTINSPLWSVATEVQIYLFFPLLLLPFWRRAGTLQTIGLAFLVGLTLHFGSQGALGQARPWYLGLFALGMGGAAMSFSRKSETAHLRASLPWPLLAAASCILAGAAQVLGSHPDKLQWLSDTFLGCGTASILIFCTAQVMRPGSHPRSGALRILGSRHVAFLGGFSYSLYLIHDPLLHMAHLLMTRARIPPTAELGIFLGVVVPLIIGLAYLFHRTFERPFMTHRIVRPVILPETVQGRPA